ncbi:putative ABC transport system permease protein [Kribbella voronezhensis]|uniref:Putative ABC transport system permease protein n=1 Tax=Kribbella voronezhensis TaxID=2512212 RepID=A0A4R7TIV9_9ACTN|nr:ABC transporter permease [Kribbella voronezhensis]TDU91909.1 putative ABC transport system permease protein [Kribbella voronezhensis]
MISLALSSLRFRTAAFLAIFVAVLLGSSLLAAAGGLLETGLRLNAEPQRLAAAPIVVTGRPAYHPPNGSGSVAYPERHGVDPALAGKLSRTAGVAEVVVDLSFAAMVAPGKDVLAGHPWTSAALTPYRLTSGQAPEVGQVVLDARLLDTAQPVSGNRRTARVGDKVRVIVSGQPREFTLAGIATPARRVDVPSIFFSAGDTRQFAEARVDALGIFPGKGTSAKDLAKRLELPAGVSALTGDDRGAAEFAGIATSLPLIILSGVFGGMVAVVMALVVSATIGLSVRQRRRELALLRASGATPGQVRKLVVAETMLVVVIALGAGLLLGRTMGRWIFGMLTGNGIVPSALRFDQSILPFAGAAILTLVLLRLTVGFAAGRAAAIRPIQALSEAAVPPVTVSRIRLIIGAVFAAATVGIGVSTIFMSPTNAAAIGGPAVLTGSIAVAVLGPVVIRALLGTRITKFLEGRGVSGILAVINLRVRSVQFAAILVPIMLASAIALGNIYSQTTQQKAAVEAYTDNLYADVVVTSSSGGIPADLAEQVRSTEGVSAASTLVRSKGWIEEPYDTGHTSDPWPLLGLDGPVYKGKVRAGSLDELKGSTIAIPPAAAKKLKVGIGDQLGVRLGDDALVKVRIVALVDGSSGYESLVLPSELLAQHTTTGLPSQLLVRTKDEEKVRQTDLQKWPGATIGDRELLSTDFDAGLGVDAWISYLLAAIAIAYTAIASINTIAVAVLDRRREFGLQRLSGSTRRQISKMLYLENLVVAAMGLVLGVVAACFSIFPIAIATRGWPIPSGPVWLLLAWVALVLLLVLPVTAIAGRLAMRPKPMDAVNSPAG